MSGRDASARSSSGSASTGRGRRQRREHLERAALVHPREELEVENGALDLAFEQQPVGVDAVDFNLEQALFERRALAFPHARLRKFVGSCGSTRELAAALPRFRMAASAST